MLQHPAIFALNHLLKAEPGARDKLRPYAGQCVEFRAPPLPNLRLNILDSGLLEGASWAEAKAAAPTLSVTYRPGALPALARGEDALLRQIDIEGDADLAATVQILFRQLRWDAAEDLSRVFGDVLAHRIMDTGRRFADWQRQAAENLAQNFAEYWTEEQPLLARPAQVRQFLSNVDKLRDDLARIEKRIQILTKSA